MLARAGLRLATPGYPGIAAPYGVTSVDSGVFFARTMTTRIRAGFVWLALPFHCSSVQAAEPSRPAR